MAGFVKERKPKMIVGKIAEAELENGLARRKETDGTAGSQVVSTADLTTGVIS